MQSGKSTLDKESQSGNTLLFGATTYRMMKGFWPTPAGIQSDPDMAKAVNESPKIVVSNTLKSVEDESNWKNVRILHDWTTIQSQNSKRKVVVVASIYFKDVKTDLEMALIEGDAIIQEWACVAALSTGKIKEKIHIALLHSSFCH